MLQLYDLNKNKISGLTKYKDLKIESTLSTGDKVLSFSYPKILSKGIQEEGYIRTKDDEYVIKQLGKDSDDYITVSCNLNLEELEGKVWDSFSSKEQTVDSAIKLAIAGTGWTVKNNGVTKKRTIRKTGCSALNVIQQCVKTYHCEIKYDSINKIINIYESIGSDKGCYFTDQLNLKELSIQSDSYDFYTIIEAYGKNDIHCTVENYQYSKKKKALYWKDERYTVLADLKEDATLKLKEISMPTRAYKASIYDLAKLSDKYKNILNYGLGDTITLIDSYTDTKLKQRIVKTVEYPDNPESNTVEISNTFASFEDIQKEQQDTTDTVNNITEDNGTISIKALQSGWIELNKVNVQEFNAVKANIGTLNANEVIADELHAHTASINNLTANKANILDLNAANAKIGTLEAKAASIDNLLNGNLTSANIQAGAIQAGSSVIAEGAIGSAQISDLSATKLTAGIINTAIISMVGTDGRMLFKNNRIQVFDKDKDNKIFERISLGDVNGDGTKYGMRIRGSDGTTILYDENGQTKEGFTDGYSKLDDNSLDSKKIDINSVVTRINGGTTLITDTKVQVGDRTLDVAFTTLSNTVSTNGSTLSSHTSSITALQDSVKLKLDEQTFTTYKSTNDSNISTLTTNLGKATTSITALQGQISLKVSQADIDNSINKIEVGGRNLLLNTKDLTKWNKESYTTITLQSDGYYKITSSATSSERRGIYQDIKVEKNTTYVLSIDTKDGYNFYTASIGNGTNIWGNNIFVLNSKTGGRLSYIYNSGNSTVARIYICTITGTDSYFRLPKFEKGNLKYTDWSPAPEDIDSQITSISNKQAELTTSLTGITGRVSTAESNISTVNSNISSLQNRVSTAEAKITDSAIVTTVTSSTAYKNALNGKVDLTTYNSKIQQLSDSISTKVESAAYNSKMTQLDSSISSKVSTSDFNSYKTQTATEISSKVAKSDFGSMITQNSNSVKVAFGAVGNGENLVKNGNGTFGLNNWKKWSGFSSTATFTNYGIKWFYIVAGANDTGENMVYQDVPVSPNTTYTFSCSVSKGDGVKSYDIFVTGGKASGGWDYVRNPVVAGTTNQVVTYTFTTKSDENSVRIRFDNNGYQSGTSHSFSFTNVKLEVGDKKTPFCLAQDEVNSASVTMDSTGVTINNGVVKCKKNNCYSLLDHGQLGFATVSEASAEQVATIQAGWRQDIGSKNINGLFLSMLGKGDFLSLGATHGNYNDTLADEHVFTPIIDVLNKNWGLFAHNDDYPCHVMLWDNVDMQTYAIKKVALEATSLKVSGYKQRIVATDNFGTVGMNAVESPDCLFEDVGDGHTDENGLCIVTLDALFSETVDTNIMYQVFLQACGEGTLYVKERTENYFVVQGTANIDFCWNIKAKQKGFSNTRLENDCMNNIIENTNHGKEEKDEIRKLDNVVNNKNTILNNVDNLLIESEMLNYEKNNKHYNTK